MKYAIEFDDSTVYAAILRVAWEAPDTLEGLCNRLMAGDLPARPPFGYPRERVEAALQLMTEIPFRLLHHIRTDINGRLVYQVDVMGLERIMTRTPEVERWGQLVQLVDDCKAIAREDIARTEPTPAERFAERMRQRRRGS